MAQMQPVEFRGTVNMVAEQSTTFTHNLGCEAVYVTLRLPEPEVRLVQPLKWRLHPGNPNNQIIIDSISDTTTYTGCEVYVLASIPAQVLTQVLNRI